MGGAVTFVVGVLVTGRLRGKCAAAMIGCGTVLFCSCIAGRLFDVDATGAVVMCTLAIPVTGLTTEFIVVAGRTTCSRGKVTDLAFVGAGSVTTGELFTQLLIGSLVGHPNRKL